MSTAISIREICKAFPAHGGGRTMAVDHVSLEIGAGELFFLLGPSGCGKTTLLRMVAGFIEPTSGSILFNGKDVTAVAPNKRNTGMVFQSYALWPHMTVEANVAFGLSVRRVSVDESKRRVREALEAVHMADYGTRKPNQLSGGQQQRVALARALVIRPSVLLLDEPLSNLDAKLRIELRGEIRRVCKASGITTVYVTHDQKEALSMADRVAILNGGRVVQIGPPEELYRRPQSRFVAEFLGETNFIPGRLGKRSGADVIIETEVGVLRSRSSPPESDGSALCSIRPEALRITPDSPGENRLEGTVRETTYLGELAQHVVELSPSVSVRVADLNPRLTSSPGRRVSLAVDPEDVVVLVDDKR